MCECVSDMPQNRDDSFTPFCIVLAVQISGSSNPVDHSGQSADSNVEDDETESVQDTVVASSGVKNVPQPQQAEATPQGKESRNPSKNPNQQWTADQELRFLSSSFDADDATTRVEPTLHF